MPKFNVLIDTNIYWKSPLRECLPFKALTRLCKAGVIKLHLPYIVEREFQTQQVAIYKRDIDAGMAGLNSILRKRLSAGQHGVIESIKNELTRIAPEIFTEVEQDILTWASSVDAKRHHVTEQQALEAMESYFQGKLPLKTAKIREDIPDAFVFQNIQFLSHESTPLIVVSEDEKIATASETLPGVTVYRSLASFIESQLIQKEILELDVIDNLEVIAGEIEEYEAAENQIKTNIRDSAGEKLLWKTMCTVTVFT